MDAAFPPANQFLFFNQKNLELPSELKKSLRPSVLDALYDCIEPTLRPTKESTVKRLLMKAKCGSNLIYHIIIASYMGDISDVKNARSAEHGVLTFYSCPRFLITKACLEKCIKPIFRTFYKTMSASRDNTAMKTVCGTRSSTNNMSMAPICAVLYKFQFSNEPSRNDLHPISSFDTIHHFRLQLFSSV